MSDHDGVEQVITMAWRAQRERRFARQVIEEHAMGRAGKLTRACQRNRAVLF
jgi:hypothetical protein